MLVALSQPHFSHYDWKIADADRTNGYARHAEFYAHVAQNHPSVVTYSMSHNATGYNEDMNPDIIDGLQNPRDTWAQNNSQLALRAEAIVKRLDPGRIAVVGAGGRRCRCPPPSRFRGLVLVERVSRGWPHGLLPGKRARP